MTNINDFKQYSQREHILNRSSMWLGEKDVKTSIEIITHDNKLIQQKLTYSPGILKLFDEAITNATDNIERHAKNKSVDKTTEIRVKVTNEYIEVYNNGFSIPIQRKRNLENKLVYLPQLVFSELNTSSNYDDNQDRERNGCNGVGIKLANIFSTLFDVEIVNNGKYYHQTFENNMNKINEPTILYSNDRDYIKIRFYPDVNKFNLESIDNNTISMLAKRTYDTMLFGVDLYFNDNLIQNLSFKDYCYEHIKAKNIKIDYDSLICYETNKVKICYVPCNKSFTKSFVNHIETIDDGTHVNNFYNQLDAVLKSKIKDKKIDINSKKNSILFIDEVVNKPTFSGQSKSKLTNKISTNYKQIIDRILTETNIIDVITNKATIKLNKQLKIKKPYFERLEDANMAGTKDGYKCTLFICEGLSAASMVSSGFGVLGHDYYGIYSLTGKILNVSKASDNKTDLNIVIKQLMQSLGLQISQKYNTFEDLKKNLRYGRVVCMKDADTDGSAIMGLLLNFFYTMFKSLLTITKDGKLYNFFNEFITPQIQVITKSKTKVEFYNKVEFISWYNDNEHNVKSIKYLKGLASNSSDDTLKYFKDFDKYLIPIRLDDDSDYYMTMAYGGTKREIELRKQWVQTCTEETYLPRNQGKNIEISPFIMNDLVLYSHESCTRSIPNIYDGLKPTQRKILYTLFSLPEKEAIKPRKVFELTAKTAEKAQYHHGDNSLNGTIMGMMQTWCGSNNIPLLGHEGFIGSRFGLGQDGGAPRYVYSYLNEITRYIFPKIDDELLDYVEEDGIVVEPKHYIPIIPMILINGATGIGTGYSTSIPLYNHHQIIDFLLYMLELNKNNNNLSNSFEEIRLKHNIDLYYPGFKGKFIKTNTGYESIGKFEWIIPNNKGFFKSELKYNNKTEGLKYDPCFLKITEIPISQIGFTHMINKIKDMLNNNKDSLLIDFKNNSITGNDSQEEKIELYLKFNNDGLTSAEDFVKQIKPIKEIETISLNNMYLFDEHIQINKYNSIYDILEQFINMRYYYYILRHKLILRKAYKEYKIISNKAKFIKAVIIDNLINIKQLSVQELNNKLQELKFDLIDNSYNYLIDMSIRWMTKDKYNELINLKNEKKIFINKFKTILPDELWIEDLLVLKSKLK
jgi:DNA topoisomerase-2